MGPDFEHPCKKLDFDQDSADFDHSYFEGALRAMGGRRLIQAFSNLLAIVILMGGILYLTKHHKDSKMCFNFDKLYLFTPHSIF